MSEGWQRLRRSDITVDYVYVGFSVAALLIAGMFMMLAIEQGPDPQQQARTIRRPREDAIDELDDNKSVAYDDPVEADTPVPTPTLPEKPLTLKEQARALVGESDDETVSNVEWWVYEHITHEYARYPHGVAHTWETMVGDCTDKAMLSKEMLSEIGIDTKLVHGFYIMPDGEKVKHDWFEVKGKTYNYEGSDLEYMGDGIW